jgi:hypothetical protein
MFVQIDGNTLVNSDHVAKIQRVVDLFDEDDNPTRVSVEFLGAQTDSRVIAYVVVKTEWEAEQVISNFLEKVNE